MIVQLSIEVKELQGFADGRDFAESLAAHLYESFNDDNSLGDIRYILRAKPIGKKVKR